MGYFAAFSTGLILLNFFCSRLTNIICLRMTEDTCGYSINCLCESSLSMGQKNHTYLAQRIYSDSVTITNYFLSVLQNGVINLVVLVALIVFLLKYNALFLLVTIFFSVLYVGLYLLFKNQLYKNVKSHKEKQNSYFSKFQETIAAIKFIRLHTLFDYYRNKTSQHFFTYFEAAKQHQMLSYFLSSLDGIVATAAQISIFLLGGYYVLVESIGVGDLTIITSYFGFILTKIRYFFNLAKSYQEFSVSHDRLLEIHSAKKYPNGEERISAIDTLNVNEVSFGYSDRLFENFSVSFKRNAIYAIVGENGSGKTSLANLLMGMHLNQYIGCIQINGCDVEKIDMSNVRKDKMLYVEQQPFLVHDTIRANLCLFSKESIEAATLNYYLAVFGLSSIIDSLPEGLDTEISETKDNFSGGEIQKICIIRALLSNADVLIFDEPTSALDTHSKEVFSNVINQVKVGKIVIIITHDDELVEHADEVVQI